MEYRLHYRKSSDDSQPETYEASGLIKIGDVIEPLPDSELFYCVIGVHEFSDGGCLDLFEPADSKEAALSLAEQDGHL